MNKIVFNVSAKDFAPAEMKEIYDLEAKIVQIKSKIVGDFQQTDRFKAAVDCAGSDLGPYSRGKEYPKVTIEGPRIVVSVPVNLRSGAAKPETPVVRYSNLPEKTLNLLLSGKLISDEEKRRLISAMTGGILDAPKAPEPVEVAK